MCVIGLFSLIGGIVGSGSQKKASQKATDAIVTALNRGIDRQDSQFQQTRTDFQPYTLAGYKGLEGYGNLLGANGADAQGTAVAGLKADPFFQQNLDDANTNLLQTASATGGVRGGNTAGAVGQLSPALLQQYYQEAMQAYGNLANLGLGATGTVANFGAQNADNVSNLYGNIGQAQAKNFITKGTLSARNWQQAGSFLDSAAKAAIGAGAGPGGTPFSLATALKSIGG